MTGAQFTRRRHKARAEAQIWWDHLERINCMATCLLDNDHTEADLPPEYFLAETACHERIAAIYLKYGI